MVDIKYGNVSVVGAADWEEAALQVARGYLQQYEFDRIVTDEEVTALVDKMRQERLATELAAQANIDAKNIPSWATLTPQELEQLVIDSVFNGQNQTQLDAWIDANIGGASVQALTLSVRVAFKQVVAAVLALRLISSKEALLEGYLRDKVIR